MNAWFCDFTVKQEMSVVVAMIEYGARLSLRKHERVSSLGGPCLYDCLGIFWLLLLHLKPIIVTPLLLLLLLLLRREYSNLHTIHYQLLNQTFLQAPKAFVPGLQHCASPILLPFQASTGNGPLLALYPEIAAILIDSDFSYSLLLKAHQFCLLLLLFFLSTLDRQQ